MARKAPADSSGVPSVPIGAGAAQLEKLQSTINQLFPRLAEVDQIWVLGRIARTIDHVANKADRADAVARRHGERRRYQDMGPRRSGKNGYAMMFFASEYEDLRDPETGRFDLSSRELMTYDLPLYRALRQWCYARRISFADLLMRSGKKKAAARSHRHA